MELLYEIWLFVKNCLLSGWIFDIVASSNSKSSQLRFQLPAAPGLIEAFFIILCLYEAQAKSQQIFVPPFAMPCIVLLCFSSLFFFIYTQRPFPFKYPLLLYFCKTVQQVQMFGWFKSGLVSEIPFSACLHPYEQVTSWNKKYTRKASVVYLLSETVKNGLCKILFCR